MLIYNDEMVKYLYCISSSKILLGDQLLSRENGIFFTSVIITSMY